VVWGKTACSAADADAALPTSNTSRRIRPFLNTWNKINKETGRIYQLYTRHNSHWCSEDKSQNQVFVKEKFLNSWSRKIYFVQCNAYAITPFLYLQNLTTAFFIKISVC